jgi:uncharacterized protein
MESGPRSQRPRHHRWWHLVRRTLRGVTRLQDTPYRIAMGAACGLFTACLPMLGQMVLAMILARILRANVLAAAPWTWITNPITSLPIWYGCYLIGAGVLGREPLTREQITGFISDIQAHGLITTLGQGGALLGSIAMPAILGSLLVGVVLGASGYAILKPLIAHLQARRAAQTRLWAQVHSA